MKVTNNRFLSRRGFGVHSPWAYDLITSVIEETLPYYAYDDLYSFWELAPDYLPQYDENIDQLLFRLVNALHPRTILEIGTGAGVSTGYLASVSRATSCITLDAPHPATAIVAGNLKAFKQIDYRIGDVPALLEDIADSCDTIDFVHLAHTALFREAVEILLPRLNERSVLVVEGITGKHRRTWFETLANDPRTGVIITKGSVGLVFFDLKMYKQHYRL